MISAQRIRKTEQVSGACGLLWNRSVLLGFNLVNVVVLALGLFHFSNDAEAQTLAAVQQEKDQPPTFLTIENPIANPGQFLMPTFVPTEPDALHAEGHRFVSIRGIIDWKTQKRILSAEPSIQDFEIQRQQARSEDNPWTGKWETLDLDNAIKVLQKSFDIEQDSVPESLLNPVITMPLPRRVLGIWGQYATHPVLKTYGLSEEQEKQSGKSEDSNASDKPPAAETPEVEVSPKAIGNLLLFRYFDFEVTPGAVYRYRVRIEYVNPFFGKPAGVLPDKSLAKGRTRTSDWSEPTAAVQVLPNAQFYLTGVEYHQKSRRKVAVLDVYKWNAPTGTFVNNVRRFGVGDGIGGTIQSKVVDPLHQTFEAQDVSFHTGDVLIDLRAPDELQVNGSLPDLERVPNGVLDDVILIMNSHGHLQVYDRMTRENERVQASRYQQFQTEIGKIYEQAARRR